MNTRLAMSAPDEKPRIHGCCPGALRPMRSGDGLIVRLRPPLARLTRAQILGVCEAALRFGVGLIELTNRAHLQLRGVAESAWADLLAHLAPLDLLDDSPTLEARRNILIAPDWMPGDDSARIAWMPGDDSARIAWMPGDDSARIAGELQARLHELPALPSKIGFAIDAGTAPCLLDASADFRIERGVHGGLILRAQGRPTGVPVEVHQAVDGLLALAAWFVDSGGAAAGRMARHHAPLPAWARGEHAPAPARPMLDLGPHPLGVVCALPFGQIEAARLAQAVMDSGAVALRLTPWRRVLLEGAAPGDGSASLALDPELEAFAASGWHIETCAGAPYCAQASVATRPLALRLVALVARKRLHLPADVPARVIHVSGCAKRCAYPKTAAIHIIGRNGRFDLDWQAESQQGLSADEVIARLEVL